MAMDAFTLHWAEFRAYANPPWNLIGRVLADSPTASRACPGGTSVEGTGMVPSATGVLVKVQFLIPTVHGENRVGKVEAIPKLLRQFLDYAPPVVQGAPHAGGMRYSKHIGFRQETGRCRGFPSQPPRGVPSLPRGWLIAGDTPPGRGTPRLSCSHANSHTTGVCQRGNLITATHRDSLPEVAPPPN